VLVTNPDLRVPRYDRAHLLRPSVAQLRGERRRAENRARCQGRPSA
jgi:hypothetical protein